MNTSAAFDAFARHAAAAVSRRGSLRTLGGATLAAALTGPAMADARKSGKKKRKKAKNLCQRQAGQCKTFFTGVCGSEANCPEAFACCELLASCNSGAFVACLGDLET